MAAVFKATASNHMPAPISSDIYEQTFTKCSQKFTELDKPFKRAVQKLTGSYPAWVREITYYTNHPETLTSKECEAQKRANKIDTLINTVDRFITQAAEYLIQSSQAQRLMSEPCSYRPEDRTKWKATLARHYTQIKLLATDAQPVLETARKVSNTLISIIAKGNPEKQIPPAPGIFSLFSSLFPFGSSRGPAITMIRSPTTNDSGATSPTVTLSGAITIPSDAELQQQKLSLALPGSSSASTDSPADTLAPLAAPSEEQPQHVLTTLESESAAIIVASSSAEEPAAVLDPEASTPAASSTSAQPATTSKPPVSSAAPTASALVTAPAASNASAQPATTSKPPTSSAVPAAPIASSGSKVFVLSSAKSGSVAATLKPARPPLPNGPAPATAKATEKPSVTTQPSAAGKDKSA